MTFLSLGTQCLLRGTSQQFYWPQLPGPTSYSFDSLLKEEKNVIEDLVKAAHNNAKSNLKSKTTEEISKSAGNFGIPGFKWPI